LKISDFRNEAGAAAAMVCRTRCGSAASFGTSSTAISPDAFASNSARWALSRVTSRLSLTDFSEKRMPDCRRILESSAVSSDFSPIVCKPGAFERLVDKGKIEDDLVAAHREVADKRKQVRRHRFEQGRAGHIGIRDAGKVGDDRGNGHAGLTKELNSPAALPPMNFTAPISIEAVAGKIEPSRLHIDGHEIGNRLDGNTGTFGPRPVAVLLRRRRGRGLFFRFRDKLLFEFVR